jgi:maleylacetoacetate isomerase
LEDTRKEHPLFPSDPKKKAIVRQMALIIVADTHPLQNLRVLNKIEKEFGSEHKTAWGTYWIADGLKAFEKMLETHSGKYCCGDEISVADICLIPQLFNARRFNVDLTGFPNILRVEKNLVDLDEFKKAHADAQEDAVTQ